MILKLIQVWVTWLFYIYVKQHCMGTYAEIAAPHISDILSDIFNELFWTGVFPQRLKYAFVLPLQKGGSELLVTNYTV